MDLIKMMNDYSAVILIGMSVAIIIMFILLIVNIAQNQKLKKQYQKFMLGKDASSLEDSLIKRISEIEGLLVSNKENKENIGGIIKNLDYTFQKSGLVKYDAFHESGGKLSFSLALLNRMNDGFIISAMHSREGCYTYIKEIIKGNSVLILSEEEKEALDIAMGEKA